MKKDILSVSVFALSNPKFSHTIWSELLGKGLRFTDLGKIDVKYIFNTSEIWRNTVTLLYEADQVSS